MSYTRAKNMLFMHTIVFFQHTCAFSHSWCEISEILKILSRASRTIGGIKFSFQNYVRKYFIDQTITLIRKTTRSTTRPLKKSTMLPRESNTIGSKAAHTGPKLNTAIEILCAGQIAKGLTDNREHCHAKGRPPRRRNKQSISGKCKMNSPACARVCL